MATVIIGMKIHVKDIHMTEAPLISMDYVIKNMMRNKGNYEIVEGFISALLMSIGYKAVKIKALLESESNKEEKVLKKSVADLIVEDTDGVKYIVEIERSYSSFLQKACFNSSRLIVDTIKEGQDYRHITKVIHISLLYTPPAEMEDPVYHGQIIIRSINEPPITLSLSDGHKTIFKNKNIFPEYIFIAIPQFNDVIQKEIDEWLYVLKHSDTKPDFKSPYMAKMKEKLSVLKMNQEEHQAYIDYLNEVVQAEDTIECAERKGGAEGLAEGLAEGKAKEKIKMVKSMLAENADIKFISKVSGLSEEEIKKLRS